MKSFGNVIPVEYTLFVWHVIFVESINEHVLSNVKTPEEYLILIKEEGKNPVPSIDNFEPPGVDLAIPWSPVIFKNFVLVESKKY